MSQDQRFELAGKTVIVTGGGKGIGKVYCRELARVGARVVVADIDRQAAETVVREVEGKGGAALAVEVDVASSCATAAMARLAQETFGTIDVLINNAALMSTLQRRSWLEIPVEEWDQVMAVNLRGAFLCCRAVFPAMRAQARGKIINISSARIWDGTPRRLHYTTSKSGIIGFTRALAREVGEYGITVNAVTPGLTLSESQIASSSDHYLGMAAGGRALMRTQYPEDLVGTIMFLASPASDFITGQTINVDGGKAMH
jgi:3-oxoacyl-[acyl-carrier protein] reductase